jgi:spore cortex biosynthesis protein YabQ
MMSLAGQTYAFLMTILAGGIVGFLFDAYRVLRSAFRPRQLATALTDLLYWIVVTPIVFAMLLAGNWGELRLYVLIGLGIGLLLYFQALSSLVIWALAGLFRGIGHVLSTLVFGLFKVVAHPFLLIGGALRPFGRRRGWSGFGAPRPFRPAIRMAWQRFSWPRPFHRG